MALPKSIGKGNQRLHRHQIRRARPRSGGRRCREAIKKVDQRGEIASGLSHRLGWRIRKPATRPTALALIIIPLTLLLIFLIPVLSMFGSMKWAGLIFANVALAPIGGVVALFLTGTNFSVSSGVGFLALFGVSVQTERDHGGVHQPTAGTRTHHYSTPRGEDGAILRLRPIMMTMLVATLGLLPAATSHGIGSDSQRPFAIVIVGGLMAALMMSIFLLAHLICLDRLQDSDKLPVDLEVRRNGIELRGSGIHAE